MNQLQPKNHTVLKRVLVLIGVLTVASVVLVACGGGTAPQTDATVSSADGKKETLAWVGRPPAYEVINGITVPPEPGTTLNNSTLAGVDVNKNGVRDDVERMIAKKSTGQAQFDNSIITAKAYQSILLEPNLTQAIYDAAFLRVTCSDLRAIDGLGGWGSSEILPATFNTDVRKQTYKAKVLGNIHARIVNARKECI